MKHFLLILFLGFVSCNGFGPVDSSVQTKNIEIASKDIVGVWKMDKFSYKYLSNFKKDSIEIVFTEDNKFEMNNSENLFQRKINNIRTNGTWKVIDEFNSTKIILNFNETAISEKLDIYKKDKKHQLWYFLSDPDSGERIRFLK